jgi:hypothetical protein
MVISVVLSHVAPSAFPGARSLHLFQSPETFSFILKENAESSSSSLKKDDL